jgi:hypothetical protein
MSTLLHMFAVPDWCSNQFNDEGSHHYRIFHSFASCTGVLAGVVIVESNDNGVQDIRKDGILGVKVVITDGAFGSLLLDY